MCVEKGVFEFNNYEIEKKNISTIEQSFTDVFRNRELFFWSHASEGWFRSMSQNFGPSLSTKSAKISVTNCKRNGDGNFCANTAEA